MELIPVNEKDVTAAIQKVSPAVVTVATLRVIRENFYDTIPLRGLGSGIIFDSNGGILTNHHIVEDASRVEVVTTEGKKFKGEVLGSDAMSDIAVVRVDGEDLPKVKLGDSDNLVVGQIAIAIGNPYGFLLPGPTATVGVVSALKRHIHIEDHMYEDLIQTDAAINPGNSGGPLVDSTGSVIGVNTANIPFAQGIGFAIPINTARGIAKEILQNGRVVRPYLGISGITLNRAIAESYDIPSENGVLVVKVGRGSPANQGGVSAGDVILEADKKPLKSWEELQHSVQNKKVGENIELSIGRNNEQGTVTVILGEATS
ncbi:MAG: trypsin-like peptidase domain-containing protein [Candidatus Bathyarchaeia archaeon]